MSEQVFSLEGIFPPIPTPFNSEGEVALNAIKDNLKYLNQFDLRGIVVLGSNGEFVLLKEEEKLEVLKTARESIPSDRLLIAGVGCQSTDQTIELSRKAANVGADAALVITPSYYRSRMTSEAMSRHYRSIAESSPIPVIIYNMPACTGIDIDADTIAVISKHPNIAGIKDSSGNIIKMGDLRRLTDIHFQILAGSASFFLPALSVGAVGGVMALANIAPGQCLALHNHFLRGEWEQARDLQIRLIPVNTAITRGWGVPALKAAMDVLGLYGGPVRPPLMPLNKEIRDRVEAILREGGIEKIMG